MKLRTILEEVTDQQSRDMITGIADILRDVKDKANREAIAKRMIRKFEREGVKYSAEEFMKLVGIEKDKLQEIGEATAEPYPLTKIDESVYYVTWGFKTDSGTEYKIVIGKNFKNTADEGGEEEYDEYQMEFLVSFGVVSRGTVDFEAEYKDVKNLFRVMSTVIKATKQAIQEEAEESGIPVTRIIMEPTKRDKGDSRRANLYMRFIEKQMPEGSRITTKDGGSTIVVDLPSGE